MWEEEREEGKEKELSRGALSLAPSITGWAVARERMQGCHFFWGPKYVRCVLGAMSGGVLVLKEMANGGYPSRQEVPDHLWSACNPHRLLVETQGSGWLTSWVFS